MQGFFAWLKAWLTTTADGNGRKVPLWGILLTAVYLIAFTVFIGERLWHSVPSCAVGPGTALYARDLSPSQVLAAGGEQLRIDGEGFGPGLTVALDNARISATVVSPYEATVQAPKHTPGQVSVTLSMPGLGPVSVPRPLQYVETRVAAITSVSPALLLAEGNERVRVFGANFLAGARVSVNGTPATDTQLISASELVATTPAKMAKGAAVVEVSQKNDPPATYAAAQVVDARPPSTAPASAPLQISTIQPSTASVDGGDAVTITGSGCTSDTLVRFGGMPARSFRVESSQVISAVTPMHSARAVAVIAATPQAISSLDGRFSFVCPVIPDNTLVWMILLAGALGGLVHALRSFVWYVGQRELVWSWVPLYLLEPFTGAALAFVFYLIIRAGLYQPTGGTSFLLVGVAALVGMFSSQAAEKLRKVAEGLFTEVSPGKNHSAPSSGANGSAATITDVIPSSGPIAGGNTVTIRGTGFAGPPAVRFGAIASSRVTVLDVTTIVAVAPAAQTAGAVDVAVADVVKTGAYKYLAPKGQITKIDPIEGSAAGGTDVTITGTQFAQGVTVTFGDKPAAAITFVSATEVKATTPKPSKPGPVDVRVDQGAELIAMSAGGFTFKP